MPKAEVEEVDSIKYKEVDASKRVTPPHPLTSPPPGRGAARLRGAVGPVLQVPGHGQVPAGHHAPLYHAPCTIALCRSRRRERKRGLNCVFKDQTVFRQYSALGMDCTLGGPNYLL